jgi:uncharacterized protein (DUF3084 family)
MTPEEKEVYSLRMEKQYDEMLSYRAIIQEEIEIKKSELKKLEETLVESRTTVENAIKESGQLKKTFESDNKTWTEGLLEKEVKLVQKQKDIYDQIEKLQTAFYGLEIEKDVLANLKKTLDAKQQTIDGEREEFNAKTVEFAHKEEELAAREQGIAEKENAIENKNKEIAQSFLLFVNDKNRLAVELLAVEEQKKLFESKQKDLENEKIKLASQQEAFKLAVVEAKRKWQM